MTQNTPSPHPALAPGPWGLPFLGVLPKLAREPLGFLVHMAHQYGDVVRLPFGRSEAYLISHPDDVRQVLVTNYRSYKRSELYDKMKPLLGEGLITSDGDFWQRQRRMMQPAFHKQRVISFTGMMVESIQRMLERWEKAEQRAEPLDMLAEMMRITQTIITRTMFSAGLDEATVDAVGQAVTVGQATAEQRFWSLVVFPDAIPTPQNRRFQRAVRTIDRIVHGLIDERRRSGEDKGDLLSMLLAATDETDGKGMTQRQLRDELVTIYLAGHETTSVALTWAWYLLSLHTDVARKVQAEVDEVLQGRVPTYEDLEKLRYVHQVVEETLRLYPPAWLLSRTALQDDVLSGYRIPAGAAVLLCPYVVHRHPRYWENPLGFDPDRFQPQQVEARHRHVYFPFGTGPHLCIGNRMSLMEAQLVLAMVVQRYRLDLVVDQRVVPHPQISLKPEGAVRMTLHRRSPPARAS
ncbi:cytochrome P450 [Hyalangium sp.]|uniref:cytochrome P450 n=1 Tax=Hyalangium sp. TaxID=2028555 RepID=UPI002D336541|nr:cytochrome P450 [Hyalangium sp.]HYI02727.1 cytochrome P450 [Hyalangium sp.]